MKKPKITVLLVDDHALVRRGFRLMLEDDPEISIVAEAGDGAEAIKLAGELRPRVVVMDCALPGTSGMDATRAIRTKWPEIAVLMLTMHSEDTWVRLAMEAGANGYILKSAVDLDLIQAVRKVAEGETVLDPKVAKPATLKGDKNAGLTNRELEVLAVHRQRQIEQGNCRAMLSLSVNTVSVHRANIMEALGIHNTAELVVYAIKNGLVSSLESSRLPVGLECSGSRFLLARSRLRSQPGFHLADVTTAAGIDFHHNNGAYGGKLLPETLGPGCAFLDYDGDGWLDILLVNGMDWPGPSPSASTSISIATTATAPSPM